PIPKSFEEVYGDVANLPPAPINRMAAVYSDAYRAVRTPDNCVFPIEVVVVQDSTGSFADDYDIMRNTQLKMMVDALAITHPDASYGLVSFRDRPIVTLGEPFDYCHRYDLPLTSANAFTALYDAYGKLWSNGGQDP